MAEEWKLVEDKDGVTVYESKWEGYSENQYKGVSVIEQPIEVIAAVLSDITSYPEWFHRCTEARKLKDNEASVLDFLLYIVIDVPWPFDDRHGIFHAQTTVDPVLEKIVINSAARAEADVLPHEDCVRITNSTQQWILEKLAPQTTRITFINQTGSSGSMSAFITDLGSQATVYQSLINMRSVAGRPRYEKLGAELKDRFN
ncbi:MAG: hypothetical protein JRF72_20860 [Deltaproteobacteria bacterium]|nr:hypothetical protein [Deltaproteobacteria bacterium]